MRKKKYALALLTLAIGASLFGCGNKEASENKADTEAGAEVTESNKEEKAEDSKEDSKKKKQYSYRWTGAWVEGGYDGSFTCADAEVQQMVEENDDALEDAVIACAAYHLTKNYMTMAQGYIDETFSIDSVYKSNYRFSLYDKALFDYEKGTDMFKSTEFSEGGKEYYILKMKSTGAQQTCYARVEVGSDNVIRYAGDDFAYRYLADMVRINATGMKGSYFQFPMQKAKPEAVWNATAELATELNGQTLDYMGVVGACCKKIAALYEGGILPVYGLYVDDGDDGYCVDGVVTDEFWAEMDEAYVDFCEEMNEIFTQNYGITLKPTILFYQENEEADMMAFGKFQNYPFAECYPNIEDKIADMATEGFECLGYKEY